MLLIIGNAQGIVIKLLILPIAIFLAYSDRTIYSLLILLSAVYLYTQSKNINLLFNKRISFVYFIKIIREKTLYKFNLIKNVKKYPEIYKQVLNITSTYKNW